MTKNNKTQEVQAELLKDALENLSLYLNELYKVADSCSITEDNKYKLLLLEKYISDMNELFMQLASEGVKDNITTS